jgi:hypothetical protein
MTAYRLVLIDNRDGTVDIQVDCTTRMGHDPGQAERDKTLDQVRSLLENSRVRYVSGMTGAKLNLVFNETIPEAKPTPTQP